MRRPPNSDRRRAEAFGLAADDYDRYRPRYPRSLIDGLVESGHLRTLDVGAGTGIASLQLIEAGAEVIAVEPDSRRVLIIAASTPIPKSPIPKSQNRSQTVNIASIPHA